MPTAAQQKQLQRLARGTGGQRPLPDVPRLDPIIATGTPDERRAAIAAYNAQLEEFFKKTGIVRD